MPRSDRVYDEPHFPPYRIHMAVSLRHVYFTEKARVEARSILPEGTVKVSAGIADVIGRIDGMTAAQSEVPSKT